MARANWKKLFKAGRCNWGHNAVYTKVPHPKKTELYLVKCKCGVFYVNLKTNKQGEDA